MWLQINFFFKKTQVHTFFTPNVGEHCLHDKLIQCLLLIHRERPGPEDYGGKSAVVALERREITFKHVAHSFCQLEATVADPSYICCYKYNTPKSTFVDLTGIGWDELWGIQ